MRIRTFDVLCGSVLIVELFLILESEAFVKISVPTAFALITAAVKIKAIWLKALLGLRAMGYKIGHPTQWPGYVSERPISQFPRYRRRRSAGNKIEVFNPDQLMSAWQELEAASGRKLIFDEVSCARASKSDRKQLPLWGQLMQSEFISRLNNAEYSSIVSSLIGSMTGDARACQFTKLVTQLESQKSIRSPKSNSRSRSNIASSSSIEADEVDVEAEDKMELTYENHSQSQSQEVKE